MKSNLSKLSLWFIGVVLLLVVIWYIICKWQKPGTAGPFANFHPENQIETYIDGYYSASLGEVSNPKAGNSAVYVDFSDGLWQAYTKNPQNREIIMAVANKLASQSIDWFALGGANINPLEYNSNELFNKVSDPAQYKDIMAPLQETLKKITGSSNDALLVTDFEEYTPDGKEQIENYPKTYFTNWLKKGNSVTIFYTDYEEVNKKTKLKSQKHLYFTVFTHGRASENSMISMMRDVLKRFTLKEFNLNNNPYEVTNDYGGKDMTGLQNRRFVQWTNFNRNACQENKLPYEVIGINKLWKEGKEGIDKYVNDIIQKESGVFMGKLLLNASNQQAYNLNNVAVKVYDVSKDYGFYAQCEEAKKHQPKLTKDKGKNDVWADESKKDAIVTTCYENNTTELKEEWKYKPNSSKPGEPWDEVFTFDSQIFKDHLKNSPDKVELLTTFHSNYKIKSITNPSALLRIDYVIDDAAFNSENPQLKDFEWNSIVTKDVVNNSLLEAIRNTLQDPSVSPKGKVLYTYYIKFGNGKTNN